MNKILEKLALWKTAEEALEKRSRLADDIITGTCIAALLTLAMSLVFGVATGATQ